MGTITEVIRGTKLIKYRVARARSGMLDIDKRASPERGVGRISPWLSPAYILERTIKFHRRDHEALHYEKILIPSSFHQADGRDISSSYLTPALPDSSPPHYYDRNIILEVKSSINLGWHVAEHVTVD